MSLHWLTTVEPLDRNNLNQHHFCEEFRLRIALTRRDFAETQETVSSYCGTVLACVVEEVRVAPGQDAVEREDRRIERKVYVEGFLFNHKRVEVADISAAMALCELRAQEGGHT